MITPQQYEHATPPFKHQEEHFLNHCDDKAWGLLWEQGTAKTKPTIDTIAYLYLTDKIDGVIVVAPPGVERNWKSDEIPAHMPPDVAMDTRCEVFQTAKKDTINHKQRMAALTKYGGLAVLLISYDGLMTKTGKLTVWNFLKRRRVIYILDEAHNIKSPKAKRTKSIIASGKYAAYKRILTGTPMAVGPFDLYSQIKFLDDNFWRDRDIDGSVAYRNHFGKWFTAADCKHLHGYDPGYDKLIEYKNLDQLAGWLKEISDRHLKDDVLDLPPKLYSKRYMEMTSTQQKIYEELRDEFIYQFDDGQVIEGDMAIVRLLRLQQILCGYLPTEPGVEEPYRLLGNKNPRLDVMEEIRDETHHPAIVWARFSHDIDQLMDMLGKDAVRYDGKVDADTAEKNKLAFQKGDAKWFVGTAQKGGPGLTLHQAKTMVYYSNSFRLIDRLQSEDRAHRAGMDEHPVNYIDISCQGTVDDHIISNLRNKVDVISTITGDKLREWI